MNLTFLTTIALPAALSIIMLGLGLTLKPEDFRRVLYFPKPIFIGLACQIIILPLVALSLCYLLQLSPEFSIGLMVLAASPGGVTSNIFSHLAKGDIALNLTLTAINSALAAVILPLYTWLSIQIFADQNLSLTLQTTKIVEVFFIVLIPAATGMWIKKNKPLLAEKSDRWVRFFSIFVMTTIIATAIFNEGRYFIQYLPEVGGAVLAFNLASLCIGYFVPRYFNIEKRQSIAISLEVGIHNGALALYMAMAVLGGGAYTVPAAIYSIVMYLTAGLYCWKLKTN